MLLIWPEDNYARKKEFGCKLASCRRFGQRPELAVVDMHEFRSFDLPDRYLVEVLKPALREGGRVVWVV